MKKPTPLNMLLITTFWQDYETFKLMPITDDCPFIEVIYERHTEMLIVLNKHYKDNFHMVPKLTDTGDTELMKPNQSQRNNQKSFKEKREKLHTYTEYFMINKDEQAEFIAMFAVNHEEFDFEKFRTTPQEQQAPMMQVEKPGLVGKDGQPVKSTQKVNKKKKP
tara:strand:- start:1567 stop:2058 length:492 start_codon:yes stop_codon:yes gene_type:complete